MPKVRIFISYARTDQELMERLLKHLAPLESEGLIEPWTDLAIEPGGRWDENIAAELNRADIILLLVSADFLASKYINTVELAKALEREKGGGTVVIPVILRFADWSGTPIHALQALPPNAKPVTDWRNRDEAYLEIAKGVRRVVERLCGKGHVEPELAAGAAAQDSGTVEQDRMLDAAMAARIPLGKPSDLAVMVRKTDSAGLKAILGRDDEFTSTPEDVKSKPFQMEFGRDAQGRLNAGRLTVHVESPDFDPPSQSDDIIVPPDRDSDVYTFLLRPLFPGELVVKLKVFARDGRNAIRLMRIFSEASDRAIVGGRIVVSIPIATAAAAEVADALHKEHADGAAGAAIPAPQPPDATQEQTLRLAEEQLEIGKRPVEQGTTRIRRFVTERPVEADVTLHEEHADVVRRAAADPASPGDIDWSDTTVEVREEPTSSSPPPTQAAPKPQPAAAAEVKTVTFSLGIGRVLQAAGYVARALGSILRAVEYLIARFRT